MRHRNLYLCAVGVVEENGEMVYQLKKGHIDAACFKIRDALNFLSLGYENELEIVKLIEIMPMDCSFN